MTGKLLKDPVYGYIEIDQEIMTNIIDSPCFQRLRNIRQTSYSPLYHSSIHNRFIHSIGVYYLGKKAMDALSQSIIKYTSVDYFQKIENIFILACLLHDVGHAPFSHTGEKFYVQNQKPSIDEQLINIVGNEEFEKDVKYRTTTGKVAAPHEIMSAIVAIKNFPQYIDDEEKDLFARCIVGYKYRTNLNAQRCILNFLIELLNSSIIDVDKLDYIIRDSHTTGFQSVSIDFIRLLNGLSIVKKDGKMTLAYHKSALSIIENVIFAHDSERKWIQNHPIVLYEHFLIQHSIRRIEKFYSNGKNTESLFSYETLTNEGKQFKDKGKISLLADEDIIYNMKNICGDELTVEYFSRQSRRHPVWKSEAEYRALFDNQLGPDMLNILEKEFKNIERYIIEVLDIPVLNQDLIQHCTTQLEQLNALEDNNEVNSLKNELKTGLSTILRWANCLKEFAEQNGIPFDFAIISANKFKSGFLKEDLEKILINFSSFNNSSYIKDVSTILSAEITRDNFFYLFYRRSLSQDKINAKDLARAFYKILLTS